MSAALEDELLRLLRENPEFRAAARRELLTEELLSVPSRLESITARLDRVSAGLEEVAAFGRATAANLATLTERMDRLTERVDRLTERVDRLTERVDRFTERVDRLADLIWSKGGRLAVVEVSGHVHASDVERAAQRAETLRRGGLDAFGLVIGRDWASDAVEKATEDAGVEWRVANDASPGFREFRRLSPSA